MVAPGGQHRAQQREEESRKQKACQRLAGRRCRRRDASLPDSRVSHQSIVTSSQLSAFSFQPNPRGLSGQASGSRPTAIRTVSFRHRLRGWARQLNTGNCPVCNTRVCARIIPPFFRLGFWDIFYRTKPISYKDFVVIVLHAIHSISDQVWGNCSERLNGGSGALLRRREILLSMIRRATPAERRSASAEAL